MNLIFTKNCFEDIPMYGTANKDDNFFPEKFFEHLNKFSKSKMFQKSFMNYLNCLNI